MEVDGGMKKEVGQVLWRRRSNAESTKLSSTQKDLFSYSFLLFMCKICNSKIETWYRIKFRNYKTLTKPTNLYFFKHFI